METTTSSVDLEIGVAVRVPVPMPVIESRIPQWLDRYGNPQPRRRALWLTVAMAVILITIPFCYDVFFEIEKANNIFFSKLTASLVFLLSYLGLLRWVSSRRHPVPYVLSRSHKQLFELAFVVVSSCWSYYEREGHVCTAILGLLLCFWVIPILNLWWYFDNIDLCWDCCLLAAIDAALVCCRYLGGGGAVGFIVVGGVGVALQLIKDAFRRWSSEMFKTPSVKH